MTAEDATPDVDEPLYDVAEVSEKSKLSKQAIRNEINAHRLVAIRYGTKYLIEPAEYRAWIARLRSEMAA